MSEISVQHINKSYGNNRVLDDVSFTLPSGKITVVLGKNGGGKTPPHTLTPLFLSRGEMLCFEGVFVICL